MIIDKLAPEALKLSIEDRATLAARLWASLGDPFELKCELEEEEAIALAVIRDEEIESGKVEAISHSDMMNRLRG